MSKATDEGPYEDARTKASIFHDPRREPLPGSRLGFRRSLADLLPTLPGLPSLATPGAPGSLKTYAPSPVWRDSTTDRVKFAPLAKKRAAKLYHRARDFERRTRLPGRQDGAVTRNGLAVLHALIFDFLNFSTGRLDPGYESIARKACLSIRSVARGLQALKTAGILNWLRRCTESFANGRFRLEQETNAYAILPSSQWRGYIEAQEPPAPDAGTWGDHPCGARETLSEAVSDQRNGASPQAVVQQLETDANNGLAGALAKLWHSMQARTA